MAFGNLVHWTKGNGGVPARRERDPWFALQADFDEFFDRFLSGVASRPAGSFAELRGAAPRVDVAETESDVVVTAELPGIDEKDVEVTVADGVLTLRGERKSESDEKSDEKKGYHRRERFYGSFQRSIQLPNHVDAANAQASYSKGILTVTLPKSAQSRVRRIEVQAA